MAFIDSLCTAKTQTKPGVITIDEGNYDPVTNDQWVRYGAVTLKKKERQEIMSGKALTDLHVNAYQQLLKNKFPNVGGLQSTLLQLSHPLAMQLDLTLQIIYIRASHWATLKVSGSHIYIYDSSYTSLSEDTQMIIAKLLCCKEEAIIVQIMNVSKQTGSTDCALFAMANLTHLALGEDPTMVVLNQDELRPHLIMMLEKGNVALFPVMKRRRPRSSESKVESIKVYCHCRMPDDAEGMV